MYVCMYAMTYIKHTAHETYMILYIYICIDMITFYIVHTDCPHGAGGREQQLVTVPRGYGARSKPEPEAAHQPMNDLQYDLPKFKVTASVKRLPASLGAFGQLVSKEQLG